MSDQDMTSDETLKLLWDQVETRPPQAESKLRNCGLKRLLNRLKYAITEAKHYQDVAQRATDENTALQAVVDKLLQACRMGHSALDQMMGDSDLPDDDSHEMKACQALIEAIRACENLSNHSATEAEGE